MAHGVATEPGTPMANAPLALHGQSVEGVNRCVHCGLCLAYCPTFSLLGTEMDSPRGRIHLIKSLAEGRIALSDSTVEHLDLCLGCRACETVCPSGVPYGELIEAARAEIERQRPGGPLRRLFRWLNFALLLPHPKALGLAAAGLRFYQASGLRKLEGGPCRSSISGSRRSARRSCCARARPATRTRSRGSRRCGAGVPSSRMRSW